MQIHRALQALQEIHGYLPTEELKALARKLDVPLHRINELVTSVPGYRREKPAPVVLKVCRDISCCLHGSEACQQELEDSLTREISTGQVSLQGVSCLGRCDHPVAAVVNDHVFWGKNAVQIRELVQTTLNSPGYAAPPEVAPDRSCPGWKIDPYSGTPTYSATSRFLAELSPKSMFDLLKEADLRGMGGAGQWAFRKWQDTADAKGSEKYIVCNGDESEPATFKDREILQRAPYLVIEGMLLAGLSVGASRGIVYIRHEYHAAIKMMREAIEDAYNRGILGRSVAASGRSFELEVFVSPGGYICGEQGALIEALEDKRAEPRNKPPQLETNGLFDKPTLLSNVETFAWVPAIVVHGGAWYAGQGRTGSKGIRLFSISGDLERPGVYEIPIGAPLRELIEAAGGPRSGRPLGAIAPSGPSGGIIPMNIPRSELSLRSRDTLPPEAAGLDLLDLKLDIDEFRKFGLMLGGGLVVYGRGANLIDQVISATRFYRNESCGKCVPCRMGSQKMVELAEELPGKRDDAAWLASTQTQVSTLQQVLELTSICGLGQSVGKPMSTWFQYFRSPEPASTPPGTSVAEVKP